MPGMGLAVRMQLPAACFFTLVPHGSAHSFGPASLVLDVATCAGYFVSAKSQNGSDLSLLQQPLQTEFQWVEKSRNPLEALEL